MVVDLLQTIGLNKYEAEAYAALLRFGPLTGYELGKRSAVPLSRSYEILERLTAKGLALQQPSDPSRYAAEAPQQFLARTRAATTATLDALGQALAELGSSTLPEGFWVLSGAAPILAHAHTLIAQAERTLAVYVAPAYGQALAEGLAQARARGCRVAQPSSDSQAEAIATVLLVADGREGLVGTLAPAERAQAVASANPGFVAALARFFAAQSLFAPPHSAEVAVPTRETQPLDWLDWEQRKQRGLLNAAPGNRAA
jgi:HTH-type transcriptional regulator, sugar sensing transcriptional regulator